MSWIVCWEVSWWDARMKSASEGSCGSPAKKWAELPRRGRVETNFLLPVVAVVLEGRKQLQ